MWHISTGRDVFNANSKTREKARMPIGRDPLSRGGSRHRGCRDVARPPARLVGQQQQQQQGDGCSTPDCKGIAVRYWGMRIGEPADITDTGKCRSCQPGNQQQQG